MNKFTLIRRALWLCCLSLGGFETVSAEDGGVASDWNAAVLAIAEEEDGFLTLKGVRTAAMLHIAMHDALSAIDVHYHPFALHQRAAGERLSAAAAAAEAAYAIAVHQYPQQRTRLAALRRLSGLPNDASRQAATELGEAAAEAILRARSGDGWDGEADYQWHPMAPGVYAEFNEHSGTPQGFVFGAGWAGARGFALQQADQFRVPPPPEISSPAYATAFEEVKGLGRFQSMQRTPDQTHIALWWKDFAENSHNRLARDLIAKEDMPLTEAARFLALLNMAIFDAYVSSFNNKFHYNHWRPYTAIRWAANDGNPRTVPEEGWTNTHRHTYAFPSYPSAHGTACAAAMAVFASVFGDDYPFIMRTPEVDVAGPLSEKIAMQPPTRHFGSFSAAAHQCGLSRVYLGIHFRYDAVEGVKLGKRVGENVVGKHLARRQ